MASVLSKLKYPKLICLILIYILTILIFRELDYTTVHNFLVSIDYFGIFFAGFFYVYELTAAPATALLLFLAKEQNILITGAIAGIGALISDIIIFYFIRKELMKELHKASKTKVIKFVKKEERKVFGRFKKYVTYIFAGVLIATPLPSEIGVCLLATSTKISPKKFILITYLLHTAGIISVLAIGRII